YQLVAAVNLGKQLINGVGPSRHGVVLPRPRTLRPISLAPKSHGNSSCVGFRSCSRFDYVHAPRSGDAGVHFDEHLVMTHRLDGLVELDLSLVDIDLPFALDGGRDILRRPRADE